jgi:hypothetical protein
MQDLPSSRACCGLLPTAPTLLGEQMDDPIRRSGRAHVEGWGTRLVDAAVGHGHALAEPLTRLVQGHEVRVDVSA